MNRPLPEMSQRPRFRPALALMALSLLVLAVAAPPTARAADRAAGQAKASAVCAACHGADGNTPIDPSYPRLAGQHEDYLVQSLAAYKNGSRKNPIMSGQAAALSQADIENLAAYYASLPGTLAVKH